MKTMSSGHSTGSFGPSFIACRSLLVGFVGWLALVACASVAVAQDAPEITVFDSPGADIFEVPAGVVSVTVEAWGGGGRGGTRTSGNADNRTGGGGGGGAYARADIEVTPGQQISLLVGAGSNTVAPGEDSWFQNPNTLRAQGGSSVANNNMVGASGGSAAGSAVPAGGVTRSGGSGANASSASGARWGGGGGSSAGRDDDGNNGDAHQGGSAPAGGGAGGGGATTNNRNGEAGTSPGGGGGGARRTGGTRIGGAGANGKVVLTYRAVTPIAQVPLFLATGLPPNILMILDNSDSMQEGLDQGRVALDWSDPACVPGPAFDPDQCPAGARSEFSKGSIVKRVGRNLVDRYQGRLNLGLMAYQQYPPSQHRNAVFRNLHTEAPATVLWRLTHRPGDLRYWECGTGPNYNHPSFYNADFGGSLSSHEDKRFFEEHPTLPGWCIYYNFAAPGYYRDNAAETDGTPENDDTTFAHDRNVNPPNFVYRLYSDMVTGSGLFEDPDSGLSYNTQVGGSWWITLTDSMRQRGIPSWGDRVGFTQLNQIEWRANHSPGLGYLHVPIGGLDAEGNVDSAHWQGIRNKLEPQRHDWVPRNRNQTGYHNVMVDPSWPLIAAGLTPLQGTMRTARAYFQGSNTNFGSAQGNTGNLTVPQSCDINAAVWVTDGLPTVRADGTELGENPVTAVTEAAAAIQEFYDATALSMANRSGPGNPVRTYVVGFARPPGVDNLFGPVNPLDTLAAAGGTGASFEAVDEVDLDRVMTDIFAEVVAESKGSAASVAANSTRIDTNTLIFQARFDSFDWSGELLAFEVNTDGTLGALNWGINPEGADPAEDPYRPLTWRDAGGGTSVDPDDRNVLTWRADLGVAREFIWGNLNNDQQQTFWTTVSENDTIGQARLEWLRGSRAGEGTVEDPGPFRRRSVVLGDIVNSEPVFVGDQDWRFHLIPGEGESYAAFRSGNTGRTGMVYVGANDGMLHGFEADTGVERLAFVPNNVFPNLARLTDPNYQHRYYVDGSPRVLDAYIGGQWRTVLVGSTGAGGNSVFAIDVTDPDNLGANKVLWELEGGDLGYAIGRPTIARLGTGDWVAIFGNGYDTPSNSAKLVIVNLATGNVIRTIDTGAVGVATPNGLSDVVPLSLQRNGVTDFVYAGDLLGNLWKFDLRGNASSDWKVAYGEADAWKALFKAVDPSGDPQPITARPLLVEHPDGGHMVLFGTGQLFREEDQYTTQIQTFYGIRDYLEVPIEGDRDQNLAQQTIVYQGPFPGGAVDVRVTSNNPIPSEKKGWYIDLIYDGVAEGERSVTRARFRDEFVVFSTAIPDPDPCGFGGRSWLMELNAFAGTRPTRPILDLDGDGEFDDDDLLDILEDGETIRVPPSGIRPTEEVGIFGTPTILRDETGRDVKILSTSLGGVETVLNEGSVVRGRQTWRQLR